jgi:glycosyltransferase involved in cell wall biosynthesis
MFLSVALCTYNGEFFLEQQLNSILNQTIQVNEIVVCDDGSRDSTIKLLKIYEKKFPHLIKLFTNDVSLGTIKNFEKAISLTKGDLIFLADQDDIWYSDKVEKMMNYFQSNPNCKLLFTDGDLIDKEGGKIKGTLWKKWGFYFAERQRWKNNNNAFFDLLENKNKITGATLCFDKELKKKMPIIGYQFFYHDAFLGIHAAALNGLFFINQSLIQYRIHDNQQVGISNNLSFDEFFSQNSGVISKAEFIKKILKLYKR